MMATIIMLKTIIALGVLAMPTVLSATGGVPGSLSEFDYAPKILLIGSHPRHRFAHHLVRPRRRHVQAQPP